MKIILFLQSEQNDFISIIDFYLKLHPITYIRGCSGSLMSKGIGGSL